MIEQEPILITGCARSGTSLTAGIVHLCGAWKGDTSGPNRNNKKGMFENAAIRNDVVKPYLRSIGADPMGQYPLPEINELPIPSNWQESVERIILSQGYQSGPWMYKGAKMCLFWRVWAYAFPDAKWVIVRRRTADIVNSCIKTGFMRAFRDRATQLKVGAKNEWEGWLWWVHQHEQRFREMIEAGLNVKIVWPGRIIDGDYKQTRELIEWLGLEWEPLKVMNFIEPKFWKARKGKAA